MIIEGSRYEKANIIVENKKRILGTRRPITLPVRDDDKFYRIPAGQKLDHIAYLAWGHAEWWWILCDLNDILDPLSDHSGKLIRIVSLERVALEVLS